jgi:hypothetical protein
LQPPSAAAKDEHKEGKFVLRLQNTTEQPVLGSLQNPRVTPTHHGSVAFT